MIGSLPKSLNINGLDYPINTDYRVALVIMQAYADVDLTDFEKMMVLIECLYEDYTKIDPNYRQEAIDKAIWFIDCGKTESSTSSDSAPRYDWEQDEQIIFSAINKVAGREVRNDEYMHWWTFMGLFNEIGEGTFATIVAIRDKLAKHKKLDKWEREYYRKNIDTVKLKRKYSESEKEEMAILDKILNGE